MQLGFGATFTLIEWLALTGFAQCLLILVYVFFRAQRWQSALLPFSYFLVLALAFAAQFSLRLEDYEREIRFILWGLWMAGPLLSYLLVLQFARVSALPSLKNVSVILFMPAALGTALAARSFFGICAKDVFLCGRFFDWLYILGGASGSVALLILWAHKGLFSDLREGRNGSERYWLVLSLIVMNTLILGIHFFYLFGRIDRASMDILLVTAGIGFVYLVMTALFRVYPPPLELDAKPRKWGFDVLSEAERTIASRIENLMTVDKLYQEPTFSRADLARELGISEAEVSKIINGAFGKNFPRFINEYRVEDAKQLLKNPDLAINVVAKESGFNSLPTFNRVFREISGESPSLYRNDEIKK